MVLHNIYIYITIYIELYKVNLVKEMIDSKSKPTLNIRAHLHPQEISFQNSSNQHRSVFFICIYISNY